MPWSFVEINHVSYSYSSLLADILSGVHQSCKIETHGHCKSIVLSFATASSSFALKEEIKGDPVQDIVNKVKVFGMHYFSLYTKHDEGCLTCEVAQNENERNAPLDAFQVMMAAAANEVGKNIPKQIENPQNGLDQLFNCILSHLLSSGCIFPKNVGPAGGTFVNTLTKLLWHLDGQYQKIEQEVPSSQKVPAIFKRKFSGYNLPEKSKHRKREIRNLSCQKMEGLCIRTKELIQCLPFLDDAPINEFTVQIQQLVSLVEIYCTYLRGQAKRVARSENAPRTPLELRTNVTVLKINKGSVNKTLAELNNKLSNSEFYTPVSVREFLPPGRPRQQMYNIIQILKDCGLSTRAVHYAYHVGGPKASLHFVWKIKDGDSDGDRLKKCVNIIRKIEEDAPIYEKKIQEQFWFCGQSCSASGYFSRSNQ